MAARSRIAHPFPWRIRLVSFLHLSCWVIAVGSVGLFVAGMVQGDKLLLRATIAGVALFGAILMAAVMMGHRMNCSVCANPVFAVRPCRKHDRARRFLGVSYRLGIAAESLLRSCFHCMYCGEKIPLQRVDRSADKSRKATDPRNDPNGEQLILTSAAELPPRRN